jgi:xanthine dehydrogenase molybdenum-binding subunit
MLTTQADRLRRIADPYADRAQLPRPCCPRTGAGYPIGGGFGGKEDIMGQIHVALLAKATGRPVKMLYTRHESLFPPWRHATSSASRPAPGAMAR